MIRIITDSGCDIPVEEARRLSIRVIPILTIFDGKEYRDQIDISTDEFYRRLEVCHEYASTAQVNPAMYHQVFEEETKDGDEVLCLTLGSKLSGCYQSAMIAKNDFPDGKVTVIDTDSVSIGQRNLVYLALDYVNKGMSVSEIVPLIEKKKMDLVVLACVDTLEYLERGGRISKTAAFIGGILSIKPVIELIDGKIKLIGKARGYKNAHNQLVKAVEKYGGIDFSLPLSVGYSGSSRELLDKYVESSRHLYENQSEELQTYHIGAAIGTHCGPGAVVVSFFKGRNE